MAAPNAGQEKRTIYIGNLAFDITEQVLWTVFCQWGQITNCKVIRDPQASTTPFAFIEYAKHEQAQMALSAMNHITLLGQEMRVNWATSPGQGLRTDKGYHIFVGDLLPELNDDELIDSFSPFGPMFSCKIIRNPDGQSRGYAFITYENESDATDAIARMHGAWVGGKTCKCNWATKKPPGGGSDAVRRDSRYNTIEDVSADASPYNTTVYCGGVQDGLTEDFIKAHFMEFGQILNISIFADKGFAFIKYDKHDSACRAIFERNSCTLDGHVVRCSWGREQNLERFAQSQALPPTQIGPVAPPSAMFMPQGMIGPTPMPPHNGNQQYEQYYNQYMDWYNRYGQQYYGQYYQQYFSDNSGNQGFQNAQGMNHYRN